MSTPTPQPPSPAFSKLMSTLAISACALSIHSIATDQAALEERPMRNFGLLAAYGYMAYRNGRSLLNYHRSTPANVQLVGPEMHRHQAQMDWDFGRTILVIGAEHLTTQPEAQLLRAAIDVGLGAFCIKSAYAHKKRIGPRAPD